MFVWGLSRRGASATNTVTSEVAMASAGRKTSGSAKTFGSAAISTRRCQSSRSAGSSATVTSRTVTDPEGRSSAARARTRWPRWWSISDPYGLMLSA